MPGLALLPTLARIGYYGGIIEGGRYVWRAAAKMAAGTALAPVLAGGENLGRAIGAELGPLDPFKILDESTGLFSPLSAPTVAGPEVSSVVRDTIEASKLRAPQLSLNVGGADETEAGIRQSAKRRFADLSERFGRRALRQHKLSPDSAEAKKLAAQSLALAGLSRKPPEDPRQLLAANLSPRMQSAFTDVIDACNRKSEPDMAVLEGRLLEAFNGQTLTGAPVSKNVGCCDACAKKKGPCKSGSCGVKPTNDGMRRTAKAASKSGADTLSTVALFGPSDNDMETDPLALDDEDELDLEDDELSDEDAGAGLAPLESLTEELAGKADCPTGACWNK